MQTEKKEVKKFLELMREKNLPDKERIAIEAVKRHEMEYRESWSGSGSKKEANYDSASSTQSLMIEEGKKQPMDVIFSGSNEVKEPKRGKYSFIGVVAAKLNETNHKIFDEQMN
jgi:hypothetical protein